MTEATGPVIENFGGNIRFRPQYSYTPATEEELLAILDRHCEGTVRVVGARHSWNEGMTTDDVVVSLARFTSVLLETDAEGRVWATVGGGCRIKTLLRELKDRADVTLPSMGLITEQTIAGAISTGTHGSGRHSLSHYMAEVRTAAYDPVTGRATIHRWFGGDELRAARCAVGCMGVVVAVRFRCVPRYVIAESMEFHTDIATVLGRERDFPLQQFYLIPHSWSWYSQERRVPEGPAGRRRSLRAPLYRLYWFVWLDVGFHLAIKLLAAGLRSRRLVVGFYRRLLRHLIVRPRAVADWSENQLVMKHELFRHLEIELFVPRSRVAEAAGFVREVLDLCAGTTDSLSDELADRLEPLGLADGLRRLTGGYTHHYPICFRRVLPDDTLISMASGTAEPWYAISFITYVEPRAAFLALADFLAAAMGRLFGARPHWGKYLPATTPPVELLYPEVATFRQACRGIDPRGVFLNPFTRRVLGFADDCAGQARER